MSKRSLSGPSKHPGLTGLTFALGRGRQSGGPWAGEILRRRLNASADELESILESRRQQSKDLRGETLRAERSDPELRAEYEVFELLVKERAERKRNG